MEPTSDTTPHRWIQAETCPDCSVAVDVAHLAGCDVARCLHSGLQRLSCNSGHECHEDLEDASRFTQRPDGWVVYEYIDLLCRMSGCDPHDCGDDVWSGRWPGDMECEEFGWYAYFAPEDGGWVRCGPEYPKAGHDLNRLVMEGVWDRLARRWRRPEGVPR